MTQASVGKITLLSNLCSMVVDIPHKQWIQGYIYF